MQLYSSNFVQFYQVVMEIAVPRKGLFGVKKSVGFADVSGSLIEYITNNLIRAILAITPSLD